MGGVFRPKDLGGTYKKIIENSIKDLSPDTKDSVINLFKCWEGIGSEEKLKEIIGSDKAERLLRKINPNKESDLSNEDRRVLNDILKDSLTFD
jgi:hypothetical protein